MPKSFLIVVIAIALAGLMLFVMQPYVRYVPTVQNGDGESSTTSPNAPPAGSSGIRGIVILGPTCPVERIPPDPACADRPYQTQVAIFNARDPAHAVAIAKSDMRGMFEATLPPGEYTVGAGDSMLPRCDHPQVTVLTHQYASTTISCDTGIR